MNLEIKHLAPYLHYGLKIQYVVRAFFDDKLYIGDLIDLNCRENMANSSCVLSHKIVDVKPLLLPLTALTYKQWISVVMAGLTNVTPLHLDGYLQRGKSIEETNYGIEIIISGGDSISFDFKCCQFSDSGMRFNQRAAFEKLHELHADIFGLIDAGLALNKLDYIKS